MRKARSMIGITKPDRRTVYNVVQPTSESTSCVSEYDQESKKFDEIYSASSAMDGFRVAGMKAHRFWPGRLYLHFRTFQTARPCKAADLHLAAYPVRRSPQAFVE